MKARVIETSEIEKFQASELNDYYTKDGVHYKGFELDFEDVEPDYWDKLKHQYAGQFLQGMLIGKTFVRDYVEEAYNYATDLVEKLKNEKQ